MKENLLKLAAFDLGAESGRAVIGKFDGEKLSLEEVHRFPNEPVEINDGLHWDVLRLFFEIKKGLMSCIQKYGADLAGMGIDTWGVDFGLLGPNGELISNPYHYRDRRTEGIMQEAFELISKEEIYQETGMPSEPITTIFQLLSMKINDSPLLEISDTLLMMPSLFNYFLTGEKATEFSIAATTQLYNPKKGDWSEKLLKTLNLPSRIFTPIVEPGTVIGPILAEIGSEVGIQDLPLITPAQHDTASAILAVPAEGDDYVYISSGTWAVMGIEVQEPLINEETMRFEFANEGVVPGTFGLLKNIIGLWLVQECRRRWSQGGKNLTYDEITFLAEKAEPLRSIINPDDNRFLNPKNMPREIENYCLQTGQHVPNDRGEFVRTALESLALKYRWTLEKLEQILEKEFSIIHMVGGGTKNKLLNQLTADATGKPVKTGPIEATTVGNLLMQAVALGEVGSLDEMREVVRSSFSIEVYEPNRTPLWDDAYERFLRLQEE